MIDAHPLFQKITDSGYRNTENSGTVLESYNDGNFREIVTQSDPWSTLTFNMWAEDSEYDDFMTWYREQARGNLIRFVPFKRNGKTAEGYFQGGPSATIADDQVGNVWNISVSMRYRFLPFEGAFEINFTDFAGMRLFVPQDQVVVH